MSAMIIKSNMAINKNFSNIILDITITKNNLKTWKIHNFFQVKKKF